jgi:hypothetical protein
MWEERRKNGWKMSIEAKKRQSESLKKTNERKRNAKRI